MGTANALDPVLASYLPCWPWVFEDRSSRSAGIICSCPLEVLLGLAEPTCAMCLLLGPAVVEGLWLQVVAPKRAALAEANKRLDGANKKLSGIRAHVAELRERVALLEASLMKVLGVYGSVLTWYYIC